MKNYSSIKVLLKENSYEVIVGKNIIKTKKNNIFSKIKDAKKIFIISDNQIGKLHLKNLKKIIPKRFVIETILITPGEKTKDIKYVIKIINIILKKKISRTDVIFALGGGVIGDLSSFIASIVLRGVNLIHFPTTLLAQVDSSVGGKTGINNLYGKNLVGTFYQPKLVICDTNYLLTLPKREMISGYAEVIKYSILYDKKFFNWLEKNTEKLLTNDKNIINHAISKSIFIKSKFVAKDEKDIKNKRALLNLGHTFAHALEKSSGYSRNLLHGEAVSIGICMACRLSTLLGFFPEKDLERIKNLFLNFGLPIDLNFLKKLKLKKKDIIKNMLYDKKNIKGKLNFVLCKNLGTSFIHNKIDLKLIEKSIC